jgi:hypothetical protein
MEDLVDRFQWVQMRDESFTFAAPAYAYASAGTYIRQADKYSPLNSKNQPRISI